MKHRMGIHILFFFYLYVLVKIILFKFHAVDLTYLLQQLKLDWYNPERVIWRIEQGNLIPLNEISKVLHPMSSHSLMNLIGNVALFIPFGVFQGLMGMHRRISWLEGLLRAFGVSLCLESSQAIFSIGSFDVDDLILNVSGGLIGFIAWGFCTKILIPAWYRIQSRSSSV